VVVTGCGAKQALTFLLLSFNRLGGNELKTIMIMFDSLNRHFLPPYGCDWVHAPNFTRLAEHAVVYDKNFVGSLPCIPARRELHTGRLNFLHRSWGPLEPFDDSMPEILKNSGIYTHITTDHMHYFEEGGATYHQRYNSWEVSRGQEGDPFKGDVKGYQSHRSRNDFFRFNVQDSYNRTILSKEEDMPQAVTFRRGIEFIERNHDQDDWFLTIETFDPHEPFFVPSKYKELYPDLADYKADWPGWDCVANEADKATLAYAALVSMCDHYLGKVLDSIDRYRLWDSTMVILCTDHGYLLGEHGHIGKVSMPGYRQVCNTPLMVWNPKSGKRGRSSRLTQTIDIPATILEFFGIDRPSDMQGIPLQNEDNSREGALFGIHSLYTCCTDGRYIYMRGVDAEKPVYNYTLMPTHMHSYFSREELGSATLEQPLEFTKGMPVLRCRAEGWCGHSVSNEDYLFDLDTDKEQDRNLLHHITGPNLQKELARMQSLLRELMEKSGAPPEYFERIGFERPGSPILNGEKADENQACASGKMQHETHF